MDRIGPIWEAEILNSSKMVGLRICGSHILHQHILGDSVAEWLACWSQAQKARVQIAAATLSGNSLRETVHTHCASVHQAATLVAALKGCGGNCRPGGK